MLVTILTRLIAVVNDQLGKATYERTQRGVADPPRPLVGAQIRRLRTDRGLTLAQVGELADLNVGYLSQVENDKASPSLETLAAIADVFEVPITWLLVDAAPAPRVVRRHERRVQTTPDGLRLEEVDGGFARGLRIVEAMAPPGIIVGAHVRCR